MTSAVAVNAIDGPGEDAAERNDVYTVSLTGAGAEKVTTVSEFAGETAHPGEAGELIQSLALPLNTADSSEGTGVALNGATGDLYVVDAASGAVDVYKFAPKGPPGVSGLSAEASSTTLDAWTLAAQVNPNGEDTHYHFEYGTASCASAPGTCASTPSIDLGAGFGALAVSEEAPGLAAGTYHYRVVGENALGTVDSAERTFTIAAQLSGLPDGRAWELVTPADKGGAEPEAITREGGTIQAAAGGEAITYVANGPFAGQQPEGGLGPEYSQMLSIRGPGGWRALKTSAPSTTKRQATPLE